MRLLFKYLWRFLKPLPMVFAAAAATADDSWFVLAGTGTQHDSNLYRQPEDYESSDTIDSAYVGLRLDKQYSKQHFFVDAVTTDFRYQRNGELDYQGRNVDAFWQWEAGRFFSGKLTLDSSETISNFADYSGSNRNIRTVDSARFDVETLVWARWYLITGLAQQKLKNSADFVAEGDYKAKSFEYGVKYKAPSGSHVALAYLVSDGDFANRVISPQRLIDSGFQQIEAQLRFVWVASGKSRLAGRVGYLEREHDNYGARNYSGAVGSLDYVWDATGKLQFSAGVRQDLASYQSSPQDDIYSYLAGGNYYNSSYYESRAFSAGPAWQMTAKTSLRLLYKREERDYEGGLVTGIDAREDVIKQLSAALAWAPFDSLSVSTTVQRDERSSNSPMADFSADIVGINLNFSF